MCNECKMRTLILFWIFAIVLLAVLPLSFACEGLSELDCKAAPDCEPQFKKVIFFITDYAGCYESDGDVSMNDITGFAPKSFAPKVEVDVVDDEGGRDDGGRVLRGGGNEDDGEGRDEGVIRRIIRRVFGGGEGGPPGRSPGRDDGGEGTPLADGEKGTYYIYAGAKLLASVEERGQDDGDD